MDRITAAPIVGINVVALVLRLNRQFAGQAIQTFALKFVICETIANSSERDVGSEGGFHLGSRLWRTSTRG